MVVSKKFISKDTPDPKTWKEALARPDAEEWVKAGEAEALNHQANKTWILVDPSEARGKPVFQAKDVFKIKRFPNGTIDKIQGSHNHGCLHQDA